jgi:hypothetical protein
LQHHWNKAFQDVVQPEGQAIGNYSDDPHENKYPLFSPDYLNYNLAKYFMEWRIPNPDPEVHNEADHDKAVLPQHNTQQTEKEPRCCKHFQLLSSL